MVSHPRQTRQNANGRGSVYRRGQDGRWLAAISLDDGRRKTSPTFHLKRDADAWLDQARIEAAGGQLRATNRASLDQHLADWLRTKRSSLAASTLRSYRGHLKQHVTGTWLGAIRLTALRPQDLMRRYDELEQAGLSRTTVHHIHAIIRAALEDAVRWEALAKNPARYAKAPPLPTESGGNTLTAAEARGLLAAARGDRWEAIYVLALRTGMRQGELLGLRWEDVDLPRRCLSVRRSLSPAGGMHLKAPKSNRSRLIGLSEAAVDALQRRHDVQSREPIEPRWDGLVFTSVTGGPVDGRTALTTHYKRLLASAGLDPRRFRFHDLRHTFATLSLEAGTPTRVVSDVLGHSNTKITENLYQHVTPNMTATAVLALDKLLDEGG